MGNQREPEDFEGLTPSALLALFARVLHELKQRKIIRSTNNPAADVAEFLVIRVLNLKLAPKSTKGYDAIDPDGRRYEIKGRRLTSHNKSRQLSFIRDLPKRHFDYLVGVLFSEDFSVQRACVMPISIVEREAKFNEHVKGWILHLRDNLWNDPAVRDITFELKAVEAAVLRSASTPNGIGA